MKIKEEFIRDLKELIAYPSVKSEGGEGAPFGKPIQDCLVATLNQAKGYGFKTYMDPEGYYGYAEIGQGEDYFAVLGHLDVVPVGDINLWKHDPFKLTEEEGYIYGRGVSDDKGPTLLAFHALKELLDEGMELKMPVRFIYGTDEESSWQCMESYVEKERHPIMGFTPDSGFPLVYAEKGLLNLYLEGPGSEIDLKLGDVLNVVPDKAQYGFSPELETELDKLGANYVREGDQLVVQGKNSHASKVEDGVNAISLLSKALSNSTTSPALRFISEIVYQGEFANKLLRINEDKISGRASLNLGRVNLSSDKEIIELDMRYPVSFDYKELIEEIRELVATYGLSLEVTSFLPPIYIEREGELVQGLLAAYRKVSGDETEAQVSGGATYARAMKNLVAFGPSFPWSESTEHQPNERVKVEDFVLAFKIYKEAFRMLLGK